jgi:hypothetical protein
MGTEVLDMNYSMKIFLVPKQNLALFENIKILFGIMVKILMMIKMLFEMQMIEIDEKGLMLSIQII